MGFTERDLLRALNRIKYALGQLEREGIKGQPDASPSFYALEYLGEIRSVIDKVVAGDPLACLADDPAAGRHYSSAAACRPVELADFDLGGRYAPDIPDMEDFGGGMPVCSLQVMIANWPGFNEDGGFNQVWIGDGRGHSNLVTTAGPLNRRRSDSGERYADLILDFSAK